MEQNNNNNKRKSKYMNTSANVKKANDMQQYRANKKQKREKYFTDLDTSFIITDTNKSLQSSMGVLHFTLNLDDAENYKLIGSEINGQMEYEVKGYETLFNILKPDLKNELEIVNNKLNGQAKIQNIKITTNYNEKTKSFQELDEQIPHIDTREEDVIFMVIPVSENAISTNVYGTMNNFIDTPVYELDNFFTKESKTINRGQTIIFKPCMVHSGPSTTKNERTMLFLEFKEGDSEMTLEMEMINEIRKDDDFKKWYQETCAKKHWKEI